ncbi:hypothetical protein SUGI_1120770 [Cryptomeria japonica]|uniref:protein PLASTID MOVEMENT IMPAIRED 1-RELATED 1 n=1 Tax=Cryptomeria japonica TaxID=3369 RepID=UPI002414CDE8|nr:protein PLASTID MOVEMENT IMPAIRED 1-RELATED 1 [Cryptomeria japonica]XP_057836415.2 protein PLASTID MOVEMENT IMPAIRED 1-RELATED 1 [Cryptomeria japonica]XP_057836416.2 protein PLASTID MOVEMENT IMPAIRED 1-RELATED 1 [Cryptomeria japonica]GLJ52657.1 hypothetical protein SUGI_1120770 [Cryptomeria japonica]
MGDTKFQHMSMKDERMKKTASKGCLHSNRVWISKLPCRNVTLNDTSSQFPASKIDFRHSTSSVVRSTFEQDEICDNPPRLSWEGFQHAGKTFDFDLKPNPRALNLHGASQLQQSSSCMEHRKCSDNDNFPKWMEDNLNFSRQIEAPLKRKKRLWNWKPLRALAHTRKQQFRCIFTLHVHRVEGLPQSMNGLLISVHWRRKYGEEQTMPARVCEGTAEFEETLHQICTIYGSRMPGQGMNYKSKVFTLFVSAVDAKGIDFGEHRIDLSILLPKHLSDGRGYTKANCSTMSFKLAGMAQEGTLSVTFSCKIPKNELQQMQDRGTKHADMSDRVRFQSLRRFSNSHPGNSEIYSNSSPSISGHETNLDDIDHLNLNSQASIMNEVSTEKHRCLQHSKDVKRSCSLAELFALELEINFSSPLININESNGSSSQNACQDDKVRLEDDNEYTVIEKGVEMGIGNVSQLLEPDKELLERSLRTREEEMIENHTNAQQAQQLNTPNSWLEENAEAEVCLLSVQHQQDKQSDISKACTCDDKKPADGHFLNMLDQNYNSSHLSSESDPDSPRACLLKQFERECMLEGANLGPELCIPTVLHSEQTSKGSWDSDEELCLDSIVRAAESEFQKAKQTLSSKLRATMLEKAEADALLEKWGMDEKDFLNSPVNTQGGFGSPVNFPPQEHVERPALAEGVGSVVKMRDGGFLGSMSPVSKYKESLLMQVSRPLVVSAETGSSVIDILSRLASLGAEILTAQAKEMMPLEDITGKNIQQLALDSGPSLKKSKTREFTDPELNNESDHRLHVLSFDRGMSISQGMNQVQFGTLSAKRDTQELELSATGNIPELKMSAIRDIYNELVFLEELVPSAMEKIEPLAVEGLKIQSEMADQDAPSNLNALWPSERTPSVPKRTEESGRLGLEGTTGLGLSGVKDYDYNGEGLMAMAITLDECMKLDAAMADKEVSERSPKSLPDHCDVNLELTGRRHPKCNKSELERQKHALERWSTIGKTLTIALRIQLHDPLRNYEPVGAPMMALVKAERVELPPSPTTGRVVDKWNCEVYGETKERKEESHFKVTNVHVAGLKLQENTRTNGWSNPKQKQSGSRWLIANGMGKSQKHPLLKQMSAASKVDVKPRETLWSISTRFHSSGKQGNEIATLGSHIRNPDIIFPNDTINFR